MKRALVSVSNKTGLVDFVQGLVDCGYQIISTGGTKKALDDAGIPTIAIDDVTHFPEMLDGRVKTLHPLIHGGLLGVRDKESHVAQMKEHSIEPIDLVCVNLYPFKETISKPNFTHAEAIENIDIGGPSMIRSAAKNHQFVTVVTDVSDYPTVIEEIKTHGDTTLETRQKLAAKAFRTTAAYDAMIQKYLTDKFEVENPEKVVYGFDLVQTLRYGENPHQSASFYTDGSKMRYAMTTAKQLHGKELSYNNIQDANATLQILKEFIGTPAVVAVKHMNPCGVAISDNITDAWKKAYAADPISIFGGIVAFNEEVNIECATEMSQMFLEIILAPSFSKEAFEILSQKKNIRLMTFETEGDDAKNKMVSVTGGLLVQGEDDYHECVEDCKVVTNAQPTSEQITDSIFGMKIVKHVKSNAIVLVKDGHTIGIGAGQMNRVGAAKIACEQAGEKAKDSVLASDAFFPMNDTVELASEYGVACIIQPGGSIKDQDSIDKCNEKNIAMIVTGKRHFKH
ncbi:MAG: bifunctional phosphoribosylaminoimidazolecarboxamide formyltransferase/IMP cyclohydrolase [Longicatena sp.]|jgi:phosphoribosylaminoimidazolecarboxamide formyltransferase / IMP cyclohydrolase|uniref:bifunctional phosphoribosylaminoimidazolecarboxamide formyltransferase/IMP cyclohydrolase n=1 Tax=Anaerorhabdus sp. TaxID=1872524 RepID=UPI002FC6B7BE